jgi:hypothetical protein
MARGERCPNLPMLEAIRRASPGARIETVSVLSGEPAERSYAWWPGSPTSRSFTPDCCSVRGTLDVDWGVERDRVGESELVSVLRTPNEIGFCLTWTRRSGARRAAVWLLRSGCRRPASVHQARIAALRPSAQRSKAALHLPGCRCDVGDPVGGARCDAPRESVRRHGRHVGGSVRGGKPGIPVVRLLARWRS